MSAAWAQAPVPLGVAESYGVLAGQAVTDVPPPVGPSVINGDLGVWPGTSVTGDPVVTGEEHVGDTEAMQAQAALTTAYDFAAGEPTTATVSADLGGQTLAAGVYRSPATMSLTGTVTLDGENDPNAVFIFQVGSDLITATDSRVRLIRGAQACNVFWQVTSSATLNTRTVFAGTILALQSATLGEGATVAGRVLARNGAVTLIHNTITRPFCTAPIAPPTISKAFGTTTIRAGGTTSLSFTLSNPNANTPLTGVGFSDALPAGLVVATPNGLSGSCGGGTITATAGGGSISLAGATLPANGSCTFSVNVTATTSGTKVNTTGPVDSNESGPGTPAAASITVAVATPPTISKAFGDATIPLNGTTSLRFTLTNPNTETSLTGVSFVDNLPTGLVVATPSAAQTNCASGTIAATPGSSSISLFSATLPANGSCTVSVNVTGTTTGTKVNTTTAVTSVQSGPGAPASATVTVGAAVVAPPKIAKTFGKATIPLNGTTSLRFTLSNPNARTSLTGVRFSDTLPAGLVIATPNGLSGSCGGGTITATAGGGSISLAGATLPANGSCTFSVNVTGTTSGTKVNTSGPVDSNESGPGAPASATVTVRAAVVAPPTIAKAFGKATIPLNGTTSLGFTLTNPNTKTSLTGVSFVDNLPTGLVVATPNGLSGSCGGGTITATAGSSSISLAGATLPANGSCTFSVNVTGTTSGTKVNTTEAVTSVQSGPGSSTSASITVRKGTLPVTGSRYSTYVTIALTVISLGTAFIAISHRRLSGRRRDTA
ncbi:MULTISPECIES: ice-binding family protein [unclassified Micromonospora]|uniref:ice-binding family protein n=1 Tax=unclassified Micromonospora TaxID=2617518 RepID=UPI00331BF22E